MDASTRTASAAVRGMHAYKYDDCPLPEGHIRIIFLKPSANRNSDIVIELQSYSIDEIVRNPDDYQFTALSYHWGDGDASHDVFVDEPMPTPGPEEVTEVETSLRRQAGRLKVRPNLYAFLLEWRDNKKTLALWIDDICLNQKDNREKSGQVPKMGTIFSIAANVSIWLGPADKDGKMDRAMDFIKTVLENCDTAELFTNRYAREWSALLYLMRRNYFSRRWIIQEIALAKNAEIRCGFKVVHWKDFSDAVGIFTLNFNIIRKILKGNPKLEPPLEGITDVRQLSAVILVDFLSDPHQSLESLVSSLSTFAVTDPRDTVYCLLNLAKEKIRTERKQREYDRLKPDYEANLLQVYTRFVQWCVQESESLDILCRHWAFPELKHKVDIGNYPEFVELPSWIKTVNNSAYGTQIEGSGGRRAGDSFVGTPESRHYNASSGEGPSISYNMKQQTSTQEKLANEDSERNNEDVAASPPLQRVNGGLIHWAKRPQLDLSSSISPKGRCIGQIAKHYLMPNGIIPKQVLQNLGYESGGTERETAPDILWRTLVADRGPDGKGPPSWYPRIFKGCLTKNTESGHMDTNRIIQRYDSTKLEVEFAKRVQAVCWNRALIDCGEDNRGYRLVGIGPADSREDDLICILYGLSVPCVLRPTWHQGGNDCTPDYYKLIGEAFILGQMDGEALRYLSVTALWGQRFCIM